MKKTILFCTALASFTCYSQNRQLKITSLKKHKTSYVQAGNKVLLAVKVPAYFINQKPADVYRLGPAEMRDSVFLFTKARIRSINDSTLIMKERNSFFSAATREIRIQKINSVEKLGFGKQLFRTATTAGGSLAAGVAIFYSYAAVGSCQGCLSGMFKAAGISGVLTRFGKTKIARKKLDNTLIEVVPMP